MKLMQNPRFSAFLDGMRFFAAFFVLLFHCNNSAVAGYEAVIVFFVLSGFLVAPSVIESVAKGTWSWRSYLLKRLTRIYIVLVPAILCNWLIVWLGRSIRPGYDPDANMSLYALVGNLLFLQKTSINVPIFGHNLPLWSLSFEFWYYLLFPCMLLSIKSKGSLQKAGYAIASLLIFLLVGKTIALYFIIWLTGLILYFLFQKFEGQAKRPSAIKVLFFLVLLLCVMHLNYFFYGVAHPSNSLCIKFFNDLVIACLLIYFVFLVGVHINCLPATSSQRFAIWKTLSGFSYSLYMTHYPIMIFLFGVVSQLTKKISIGNAWVVNFSAQVIFLPITLMGFAWIFSLFTEAKTTIVRNRLATSIEVLRQKLNKSSILP